MQNFQHFGSSHNKDLTQSTCTEDTCAVGSVCTHQEQALLLTPARTQGEFFNLTEVEFPSLPCSRPVLCAHTQM